MQSWNRRCDVERSIEKLRGYAIVRITGAEPKRFLNNCKKQGIMLRNCKTISPIELECRILKKDIPRARHSAEMSQCELKETANIGAGYTWMRIKKRYFLLLGMLTSLIFLAFSGLYIWDIEIEGNETVPDYEILNILGDSGVYIGANWTGFNADQIRSEVLYRLPELSFLTVNVNGSKATVQVRERIAVPEMSYDSQFSDIIATKNAVISSVFAYRGFAVVQAGSTVKKGDVLISGNMPELVQETPKSIEVSALGEVWGETYYEISISESLISYEKVYTGRESENFAIVFGEKRLNFYTRTGIYRAKCDTIYDEWILGVENLISSPISLVRETRCEYETVETIQNPADVTARLETELLERLERELGETGKIIAKSLTAKSEGNSITVTLKATCHEQIGEKYTRE